MHLGHRLILTSTLLATAFFSSAANAVNTFNNRTAWQSAAGVPETVTFATDDAGNPLSNPPAEFPFGSLTLKGATFKNGVSAYNDHIYVFQGEVMRIHLPLNTTAFGLDWAFQAEFPGITTFRLSSGEVFHPPPEGIPNSLGYTFFGVTSDTPIEWVELSLNSTALVVDNFSFVVPPVRAGIDIKPGSATNAINPHSEGVIPVALLAAPGFSTCSVDWHSLRFGATGSEARMAGFANADVNHDGRLDLILFFRTAETGIMCGSSSGALSGQTVTGSKFRGVDSVRTVGCRIR